MIAANTNTIICLLPFGARLLRPKQAPLRMFRRGDNVTNGITAAKMSVCTTSQPERICQLRRPIVRHQKKVEYHTRVEASHPDQELAHLLIYLFTKLPAEPVSITAGREEKQTLSTLKEI